MKTTLIILALSFGQNVAHAQKLKEADVPAPVKEAFKKQFPNSKVEKWEKEGANFEAEFDLAKAEMSAVYTAEGTLVETEVEIKVSELPQRVSEYMSKNAAGKKIKEASKITSANGTVTYEAEVDEDDFLFDNTGNFLRKELETDQKDEKD